MDERPTARNTGTKYGGAGFTLTELLVALLIGLLVLAGVHRVFIAGLTTQNTASLQNEVNRKAQVGLDSIVSKLRGARGVISGTANRICFSDQEGVDCSFRVTDGVLYRTIGAGARSYSGGERVATDVKTLQFTYRDRAGAPITDAPLAYSVDVLLEIERSAHTARLQSAVRPRNK